MTFEQKVIAVNEEQNKLGFEGISTFKFKGIDINNPYMDIEYKNKVIPEEYYGEKYKEWKQRLKELSKEYMIENISEGMNLIIRKTDNQYEITFDNSSMATDKPEEIIEELEEYKNIFNKNLVNKVKKFLNIEKRKIKHKNHLS